MSVVTESVKGLVEKHAKKFGLVVVDVEYKKKPDGMNLTIFIDKPGGVNLDDCAALHEAIDSPLDELDPTNGASYTLNVSSVGLDRDLNTDELLRTVVSNQVDVSLFAKVGGKKYLDGYILQSFDENQIVLQNGNGQLVVPRTKISKITKHINF